MKQKKYCQNTLTRQDSVAYFNDLKTGTIKPSYIKWTHDDTDKILDEIIKQARG